jgi:hypothetical protein
MKKTLIITLGVVVLIIIITVVTYFSFQRKVVFNQVSHSDWKTYVNESAGYSIQYPSNVLFSEDASSPTNKGLRNIDLIFGNDAKGIRISALVKNVNWDQGDICSNRKIVAIIDSTEWQKQNCKIGYMDVRPDITEDYTLDMPDFTYKIQLNYGKAISNDKRAFMESILSTFKFVEKSNVVKETNTYTSDKLKVSFQYPADWRVGEGLDQVVVDAGAPSGEMRFDLYRFDAATRTDLKDNGVCKIIESTEGAKLDCVDKNLADYIVRYGNNIYKLSFSKRSWEESDPQYKDKFNQLTTAMFAKNTGSFQTILNSIRFMK